LINEIMRERSVHGQAVAAKIHARILVVADDVVADVDRAGDVDGNAGLVILLFGVAAVLFIGLGMVLGTVFSYRAVSGVWAAVLMLTIFGGAWFDLDVFPGVFRTVAGVLPFAHAMDGARAIMVDGAGFGDIAGDFIWVLGYAAGVALLAIVLMRRRIMQ